MSLFLSRLGRGVEVLKVDANGLIAFNKPNGILSHPNETAKSQSLSLINANYDIRNERYIIEDQFLRESVHLLHRLDAATSGVILATTNEELANILKRLFKTRNIAKEYQAMVFGKLHKAQFPNFVPWEDDLHIKKEMNTVRTQAPRTNNKRWNSAASGRAITEVSVLSEAIDIDLVSTLLLRPKTGFSHQLRYQCSSRGLPIIGDEIYGDFQKNRAYVRNNRLPKCMLLHAQKVRFSYRLNEKDFEFSAEAPLPLAFRRTSNKALK